MPGPGVFVVASGNLALNCAAGSGTVTVTAGGTVVFSGNQTIAAGSVVRTAGGQVFTLIDALSAATTLNPVTGSSPRYTADASPAAAFAESAASWTVSTEVETVSNGINSAGEFTYYLDYNALAVGERVRVRVYKMVVAGGTSRLIGTFDAVGAVDIPGTTQLDIYNQPRVLSIGPLVNAITDTNALRITVTQLNGTARTLVQSVLNAWDGTADMTKLGGATQSATDLKDFADDGYDPSTNKVTEVATLTGHTPQTGNSYAIVNDGTNGNAAIKTLLALAATYIDTEIAAILADTNELQTDWTNGGRLDLLIDAIKAKTDNLPSDPADQSQVEAAITAATTALSATPRVRFGVGAHTIEGNVLQLIAWLELHGETVDLTALDPAATCHAVIIPFGQDSSMPLLEVSTGDWDEPNDDSLFEFTDDNPAWITDSKYTAIVTIVADGETYSTKHDFYVYP